MKDLAAICEKIGFASVCTYIQSGNVVFVSRLSEGKVKSLLEAALEKHMGKRILVIIRTHAELRRILDRNPFPDKKPAKVGVAFLEVTPPPDVLDSVVAPDGEQVHLGEREIYVYYPVGMGRSKLRIPLKAPATVRNVNTVAKLLATSASEF